MPRADRRAPPPWAQAPGRATGRPEPDPPTTPGPPATPDPRLLADPSLTPLSWPARTEPPPDAAEVGPRWPERRARPGTGVRARRPVRSYPRGRWLGAVAAVAAVAMVGGTVGTATSGPSPPGRAAVAAADVPASAVPSVPGEPARSDSSAPVTAASEAPAGTDTAGTDTAGSDETGAGSERDGRAQPGEAVTLAVRKTGRLGSVVVDAEGFTLYRFDGDAASAATCADACTSTWRPVTVDPNARIVVNGVESSDIGVVRRRDGTVQLALGGWPVYRFAGDTRPGEDGGQGIGNAWFALTPTGGKAEAT